MRTLWALLLCMCLSLGLMADPFNGNRVPEKAKWFLHFDMDNFKNTSIGKSLIAKALEDQNLYQLHEILRLVGIDPAKNLKNVTIYGMDFNKSNWLLAYEGSIYVAKLLDLIKSNGSYEMSTNNGIDVYSTVYNGHKFYFFLQQNVLYLSKDIGLINAHIQMIIGKEKSLKDAGNVAGIASNTMMVFGSADRLPDDGKDATMTEIIKIVTKISGGVKEEMGTVKGEVVMETSSPEATETLQQFLQGVISLGKLRFAKTPTLLEAVKAVEITKNGNKITVKGGLSSDSLFELIKQGEHK